MESDPTGNKPLLEKYAPALKNLIRFSSAINGKDIKFYNSIDNQIKEKSNEINSNIIDLMNDVLMSSISVSTDNDLKKLKFKEDFEEENNKVISNVLDTLLEKVELNLDNHVKFKKNNKFNKPSQDTINNGSIDDDGYTYLDKNDSQTTMPKANPNMTKPQDNFLDKVSNFESTPFKPLITLKPNAVEPLEESKKLIEATDNIPEHYKNPYSYEIMNAEYPEWILNSVDESEKFNSIPWIGSPSAEWIDTPEQLDNLLIDLNKCKVIAIDLEHHDYRTYHGLTSLMQITSDSKKDYLIDPLSPNLRPHLQQLNIVFTNPNIIKVFHGAFMDVIWLQRDLGLYLVSLFDTFHAAKNLHLGKYSLAFLLEYYAKFRTSKKWQLADWRIRPLSLEMMDYAKADTHFLIEIFYKMHDELLKIPNALQKTLYSSRKVALRRFEYSTYKPKNLSMSSTAEVVSTNNSVPLTENSNELSLNYYNKDLPWTNLIFTNGIQLKNRPLLEILFKWRDNKARENDESPRFIMSDFVMVSLATNLNIGDEDKVNVNSVMSIIETSGKFGGSFFIRKCVKELTKVIKDALVNLKNVDLTKIELFESEGNDLNTDKEIVDTVSNSVDLYETVKDVNDLQKQFNKFNSFYNQNFNFDTSNNTIIEDSQKLRNANNVFAIEYVSKGEPKIIKNKTVNERLAVIIEKFTDDLNQNSVEFTVDTENIVEEENDNNEDEEIEETKGTTERDEIITLRKKRNYNNISRKRKNDEDELTEVNFNKSIMEVEDESTIRRNAKKQKKKPSFDPYSKDALSDLNIPQLKKKKYVDRGKNVVFKQQKK